jgi:hydrogenase maturation factor
MMAPVDPFGSGGSGGSGGSAGSAAAEDLAAAALVLARRFAAGATMWCVAPQWPAHGRHVAVEFVHPVIVGKRALPAVHIGEVGALRLLARPGDVVLALGTAGDPAIADLLRRAEAWGLTRLWLGVGPRPPTSEAADRVVWAEGVDPALAARSGDLVLLYHLLWELTHVVFEHPGLLEDASPCTAEVCITCSDQGRVAEVVSLGQAERVEVVVGGLTETVDVSLVEPVAPGDLLLVHAGVALTILWGAEPAGKGAAGP